MGGGEGMETSQLSPAAEPPPKQGGPHPPKSTPPPAPAIGHKKMTRDSQGLVFLSSLRRWEERFAL